MGELLRGSRTANPCAHTPMHEVGIAQSILDAGRTEAAQLAGSQLKRIGVRIGVLCGVDLQALEFALMAIQAGTEFEGIQIDLQICLRKNRCSGCGHEFETELYSEPCPKCANPDVQLIGGTELELACIEVDEP